MLAAAASSMAIAPTLRAQPSPTPFPVLTPSPTATPAVAPPNNNPYLDATFRTPRLVAPTSPLRVLRLSSGKFLTFYNVETLVNREAGSLQRYHADGTYDPSFRMTAADSVLAVAEIGNQLLVAAVPNADSPAHESGSTMQVLRLNEDGSLDPTFSANAVADDYICWITVQPDGKILLVGDFFQFNGVPSQYMVRLLPSGEVDSSFTSPNFVGGGFGSGNRPVVQPDGRILIAGNFTRVGDLLRPRVARLNANGTVDTSFVPSGFTAPFPVRGLLLLPNGQIVIASRFTVPASFDSNPTGATYTALPLLRLEPNGAADESFGCFDQNIFLPGFTRAREVTVQSDGKFLAVATRALDGEGSTVFRFNADGKLDGDFHRAALRLFVPGTSDFYTGSPTSLALEPSGMMWIAGSFNSVDHDGIVRYGVTRLQADGTPTPFAPELAGLYEFPSQIARFGDGRTWICSKPDFSQLGTYNTFPHNLARLNSNGTFDFSFDLASSVAEPGFLFDGVVALADDKAFVWGIRADFTPKYFRVSDNGTIDNSFIFDPSAPQFAEAAMLAGGKVLLSAGNDPQATVYASVSRLQTSGARDNAFHLQDSITASQVTRLKFIGVLDTLYIGSYPLAVQTDGKVLFEYFASDFVFHLVRLNTDGLIDDTFAASTFAAPDLRQDFPVVFDPVTQETSQPPGGAYSATRVLTGAQVFSDGRIVLVGHFRSFNGTAARGVVRLLPNGTLDNNFSVGGGAQWTTIAETETHFPAVEAVSILDDGDLLIVGDFQAFNGVAAPGIARLHSDGSVEASFSPPVHRIYERLATAKLFPQADGSLMLSGPYSFAGETIPRSLVRLFFDHPLVVSTAVSRKTHGAAGNFDITLPGVECRSTGGAYTLVLTFSNNVVSGNASVTAGAGSVSGSPTFLGNRMTVSLTGVANAQTITVTLSNVTDSFSQVLPNTAVNAGFLIGDTNGDGFVNAGDALQTRNRAGQTADATNFRSDVNADGFVNSGDTILVRARSGTFLP